MLMMRKEQQCAVDRLMLEIKNKNNGTSNS
jgi:hypothetical protein